MASETSELRSALVEAYPVYVAGVLESRGLKMTAVVADAVVEGCSVLDGLLTSLERLDPIEQRHSPLELFAEALRPVDHALEVSGVPPPRSPLTGVAAWDRYGLAPGSSQILGARANEAHLQWGIAKAAALAPMVNRPVARVIASREHLDQVTDILERMGYRVTQTDTGRPTLAVIDIDVPGAHDAIRRAAQEAAKVVAFGDDLDDLSMPGVRALGASTVVRTDDLVAEPERFLPTIA